jgi:hypothetical protein
LSQKQLWVSNPPFFGIFMSEQTMGAAKTWCVFFEDSEKNRGKNVFGVTTSLQLLFLARQFCTANARRSAHSRNFLRAVCQSS